jgi:hypothetical protein
MLGGRSLDSMTLRIVLLTVSLCSPLLAQAPTSARQAPTPVQLVDAGRAKAKFADPFTPSPIQTTVGAAPAATERSKIPTFQQYLAARSGAQPRVNSKASAEAWVNEYSGNNESTIDPVTGMPKFSTTITSSRDSMEPRRQDNSSPGFAFIFLKDVINLTTSVPSSSAKPFYHGK